MADAQTLRSRLVGAWSLDSYIAYPPSSEPGKRPIYPMTRHAKGFILYTPDGYMSAQIFIPGQLEMKPGVDEEQQWWAENGKRYFGYCGPYYITEDVVNGGRKEILSHHMVVSNTPAWTGNVQERAWRFEENDELLVLGGAGDGIIEIKGEPRVPELRWRRCRNNSDGVGPQVSAA